MIGATSPTPGLLPATAPAPRPSEAAARPSVAPPPLRDGEQVPMPAEVTFGEFLAALNPLHHIPVVGWIYRQVTGETIQPVFRVLGGLLTGGPIGAIASAVGALAEQLLGEADTGQGPAGGTAVADAASPASAPAAIAGAASASAPASGATPGSLASITTSSGQPLQPLPLATRLAARAYPAPALPMREAAPPPDPVAGFVPAAAALTAPERATSERAASERAAPVRPRAAATEAADASAAAPPQAMPGAASAARVRRAPVVPVTSSGQDPAFMQQMMRGLEAYERAMRARTTPQAGPGAP
jgi:hypothetical protein